MAAKLFFSNSPLILLDKLSENLEWSDPFKSPHIATPTPAMKRWVQMRLSEKRGIVANVDFLQLERMLWQRLETLDGEHVVTFRKPARLLDEPGLQLLILSLLRRQPPPAAKAYLDKSGAENSLNGGIYAQRLCQLSRKLAGFFREYEYSRVKEHGHHGLAYAWKHGEDCFLPYLKKGLYKSMRKQVEALERWQREIYHELFRPGGLRDALGQSQGQYQYTLPQYAEMVLEQKRTAMDSPRKPPSYHLFGLSQVSSFHRSLIQRLADRENLQGREAAFFIYSLNPCAEYWEDALTPGEKRSQQENLFQDRKYSAWRQLDDLEKKRLRLTEDRLQAEELPEETTGADLHLEADENPILSQWGKPGRENIRLWCQVTHYDFFEHFQASRASTLLATVQEAILHRRGRLAQDERVAQDDSLQILACPEIHREVETVHQGILAALKQDPSLRPDDIAVVVPKMGDYRDILSAVFGRTEPGMSGHVPFNLSDASASSESDYARAVKQMFALAKGRFSRREFFNLAANPCFRSGLDLDEATLRTWSNWTHKLNIFHGFDEAAKRERGYASEPLHTWSHGLDRLLLGTVMDAPPEEDPRHFAGIVPFADGSASDRDELRPFLELVGNLNRDISPLRKPGARTWSGWLQIIGGLFDRYLACPPDQAVEAYVQADIRRYLASLADMEVLDGLQAAGAGSPLASAEVTAAIPMDLILSRLDGLKAGKEPYLSGGVNVSGLSALRSLPFKFIYVLGLGEGRFPEDDEASTLDLRQYRRVIGEVTPSARNRYMFLETLVCAGAKLRLSYVSRDAQQGKTFQMGSILNELVDYLEGYILAPGPFQVTQVPLLSRHPTLFRDQAAAPWDPPPNPFRQEKALAWLENGRTVFPRLGESIRALAPEAIIREIFPPLSIVVGEKKTANPQAMPLEDIRLYLENPVQYSLQKRLAIRDSLEEDPMDLEDEPFFCPFPKDLNLLQNMVIRRFQDWENTGVLDCLDSLRQGYDNLTLRGFMPEGPYRELDRQALVEKGSAILEGLESAFTKLREGGRVQICTAGITLGDGGSGRGGGLRILGKPGLRVPETILTLGGRQIALHGSLPCLFRCPQDGGCATVVFANGALKRRQLLSAYLFYLAGVLSDSKLGGWLRNGPFTIYHVSKSSKAGYDSGNWAPFRIEPTKARAYLENLVGSMLGEMDFDLLPFDLIAKYLTEGNRLKDDADFTGILRDALETSDEASGDFAEFTPTESMRLLDPQVPEDAEAKIRARLALFFNFIPDSQANHEFG